MLTGGSRTALARQQTLRAAVGGSGDVDALDVAGLLGSLVDKSVVVAEPGEGTLRYRLLETIRLFAAERLAETGDAEAAAVSAAHCAHFPSVAEAAALHLRGPEQGSWLARLDADQANLLRAAQYAAAGSDGTALVLRFGVAIDRYWAHPRPAGGSHRAAAAGAGAARRRRRSGAVRGGAVRRGRGRSGRRDEAALC